MFVNKNLGYPISEAFFTLSAKSKLNKLCKMGYTPHNECQVFFYEVLCDLLPLTP